jgi:hypothetical protein
MDNMDTVNVNRYSYLDQLSPAEVLQLLTAAAEKCREHYADLSQVRLIFPGSAPFKFVTLEVPDPYSEDDRAAMPAARQELFGTLIEGFKDMTGRGERYHSPGGERKPLLEGISWLLLKCVDEADDKKVEGSDEYVVVTRAIDEKEAEVLFKNLSFHATSTRVSSWENRSTGAAGAGGFRYLFHLKDDRQRKSSFQGIAAGGIFETCCILRGFEIDGLMTFLPAEIAPGEKKLRYFCRLLEKAPGLFGSGEKVREAAGGLLAAVLQWPGTGDMAEPGVEFLYIAGLRFFQQDYFTRRKVTHARFEFMKLKESRRSLERLREAIKNAKPSVGYRLELRSTRYLEKNDLQRLHEQKARLEYNLAYLESIMKPRPVLLRFTQKQLPALAAGLRSFPLQVIYEGSIKYGFQATESEPGGYHFILVNPAEAPRTELDPLPLFQGLDVPHMRFHLDPFWARHYFEARDTAAKSGGGALLFVPEGCALFPSIHSWNRGNAEYFLRETMAEWFKDQLQGKTIPDRPIYIFDGAPQPKARIYVSILDQTRMEPLHTRLGWINDNLIVNHAIEKENLIKEMARDITWGELAQKIKNRTAEMRKDFTETALAASNQIAQTTNEMTRVLTAQIDRVVKETYRMMHRIRMMNERLREWDEALEDMENILQDVRKKRQDISQQKGLAKNEFWRMEQEIERELKHSEKRRQELQEQLDEEIKKMQETGKILKQRLRTLKL